MSDWKAQSAQVVLFPVVPGGAPVDSALELYKAIWQTDPDSFQKHVAGSPFVLSSARGTVEGLAAACLAQPIRIDFTLAPLQQSAIATMTPLIDDSKHFSAQLAHLIEALGDLQTGPQINRVSCVVKFAMISPNFVSANKSISSKLPKPYHVVLSDETDFVLQINRARPSKALDNITINFITKWSIERTQLITFTVDAAAGQALGPSQMVHELIMPNIVFDNNNVQLPRPMSKGEQKAIFAECLQGTSAQLKECNIAVEGF
jgi:hypothetical protein